MQHNPPRPEKFADPYLTATGEVRASVPLLAPRTLWFNTGTLCNIACVNCYIDSSPGNDALVYITLPEVESFLDQIAARGWPVREIGFTGGEPFLNPQMCALARAALARGHEVLILTNAMQPMMRPRVQQDLEALARAYGSKLTLRVSLDHFTAERHDAIRGAGGFARTLAGMAWARERGIRMTVAGRTIWGETEARSRAGFAALFAAQGFAIDAEDPAQTVLFPELDDRAEVPEITTSCWTILDKRPEDMMCASSRMVVRRRGAAAASVVACTLLPHAAGFDLGPSLETAERDVQLNHRHCARFCVLGGASCS